jgi:hypothetical protein
MSTQLEALGIELIARLRRRAARSAARHRGRRQCAEPRHAGDRGHARSRHAVHLGAAVAGERCCRQACARGRRHARQDHDHQHARLDSRARGTRPGLSDRRRAGNFDTTARLGAGNLFVIEADEYDTAFFDKRAKFVHYRPRTAMLNNLEYDHADIYPDVAAIRGSSTSCCAPCRPRAVIVNGDDAKLAETLSEGCWTPRETFSLKSAAMRLERARRAGFGDAALRGACNAAASGPRVDWPLLGDTT